MIQLLTTLAEQRLKNMSVEFKSVKAATYVNKVLKLLAYLLSQGEHIIAFTIRNAAFRMMEKEAEVIYSTMLFRMALIKTTIYTK
jgi:hypothetical protein